jgi:hypothetical protein
MDVKDFYVLTFVILCIVISIGTIGNIISLIIWTTGTRCRKSSLAIYFKILPACDLFVLLLPGIDSLLKFIPDNIIQLRTQNDLMCKFMIFTTYFGVQLSVWVSVAMTIECAMALCFPVEFYHRSNKTRCAVIICGIIIILLAGLNIPISLAADLVTINRQGKSLKYCNVKNMQQSGTLMILTYLSSIGFYVALPVILFTICDVIILVKLCEMRCSTQVHRILTRNIKSTAKLIISVNLIHVIANIPVLVTFLTRFDVIKLDSMDLRTLSVISYGCLYLSNAVKIFVFYLMKTDFRYDMRALGRRLCVCCISSYRQTNHRQINLQTQDTTNVKEFKLDFKNLDSFWV